MPTLEGEKARRYAELLREYLEANKAYGELLPRWAAVGAGEEPPALVITEESLEKVKAAQDRLDAARAALNDFYRNLRSGG